jgi:hypothetical protein
MKYVFGPKALFGLALLFAGTTFLIVELLQRHRYETRQLHLVAALEEFKARCALAMDERLESVLASEGTRNPGRIEIRADAQNPTYRHRNHSWQLTAMSSESDPRVHMAHRLFFIALVQRRTLLLQSPQVHVLGRPHPSVMKLFDDILRDHGLTYKATLPPD